MHPDIRIELGRQKQAELFAAGEASRAAARVGGVMSLALAIAGVAALIAFATATPRLVLAPSGDAAQSISHGAKMQRGPGPALPPAPPRPVAPAAARATP